LKPNTVQMETQSVSSLFKNKPSRAALITKVPSNKVIRHSDSIHVKESLYLDTEMGHSINDDEMSSYLESALETTKTT